MPGKTTSITFIKEQLSARNFAPRKSLGQNFLTDENILLKIVAAGDLGKDDVVLEIGPGLGALTEKLLELSKWVVAIEYDRGLFTILHERFDNFSNLVLLNQDVLATDLAGVLKDYAGGDFHFKVLANLPYYITTPIIFQLIESGLPWKGMVFLVQKEVANRLLAGPGTKEYGALTVMLNFYGKTTKIGNVPKTVFYPIPQVDSTIIRIDPYERQDFVIYPYLHRVVQAAFGQRRKTILNALMSLGKSFGDKESIAELLRKFQINPLQRGETLSIKEFLSIAEELQIRSS
ncbi:MAG TPA: 16S rRNA (adenine(1518)-N(6)/adenine(1519)-N(6))-dimethyltransferase [Firmicutes bacterium]|jgi:16S rRNA (adenine1518-N6/adenine1519-N6)-dimethyltransferase|nr:16S rRNA (adenine(1518)-N(6)/adenine(1519)-N(6))-dimethyltransferase [Bacillota bacterium]